VGGLPNTGRVNNGAVAIIVAAGSSQRAGFDKLRAPLAGRPVLEHSLDAFQKAAGIRRIILVAAADRIDDFQSMFASRGWDKLTDIVAGGSERHLSVLAGLKACADAVGADEIIAVHDGARPLIRPKTIDAVIAAAAEHGAAVLAHPLVDTIKRAGEDGMVSESVDRDGLWAMETPQAARHAWLSEAFQRILDSGHAVTDEVSALQAIGKPVHIVANHLPNPKITFPNDLVLAESLLDA